MGIAQPRIDPRVARTRALLEQAFVELLRERSFQALTVGDIAARATVNRATFYAHFADKYALMDSLVRGQFRATLARSLPAEAPFTVANLEVVARAVCDYLATVHDGQCRPSDHAHLQPLLEAAVPEELQTYLADWLQRLPRPGSPAAVTPALAATAMSWALFGAGLRWSRGERAQSADAIARQVVATLVGGVPRALGVASQIG